MAPDRPEPEPFDEILNLEPSGEDVFRTVLKGFEGRSFGGQTLGCATLAAARTCPDRPLHSLHVYFLRPVPADVPIELRVERVKEGRRLAHRRVRIGQGDRLQCELLASFAAPGEGLEFQDAVVDPGTPQPDALPSDVEVARAEGWEFWGPGPFELRWVGAPWRPESHEEPSRYLTWARPRLPLPGHDRGLCAATLAFLGDFHSHWPVARKLGGRFEPVGYVTLDYVMWLHRDLPWDDWWLVTSESDIGHAGRALTRRRVHARDGRLVATIVQEQLIP